MIDIHDDRPHEFNASPTKKFFVEMLTRDIELEDAILDLLDNCIDGIQRTLKNSVEDSEKPYKNYWAKLTIDPESFSIEDNCGGIPRDIAENYAFRMGRPDSDIDRDIYTIGSYGIGMKRAIFKIGQSSEVISQTDNGCFRVTIHPNWLTDDNDWKLPFEIIEPSGTENGTLIKVGDLHNHIKRAFSRERSPWYNSLVNKISHHYSYILHKGFTIFLNGRKVTSQPFSLLWEGKEKMQEDTTIAPYLYKYEEDGVEVKLAIGFYRNIASETEVNEETQGNRNTSEKAGWTIICNDRVVLYCDKTRLTGWGDARVPSYHPQFIAIAGIVYFRSKDMNKLPMTTTKRGIDTSFDIYLYIKNYMIEGLQKFTSYTNKWKKHPVEEKKRSAKTIPIDPIDIFENIPDELWKSVRGRANEKRYIPKLPIPKADNRKIKTRNIKFTRPATEIQTVAFYLFEDYEREASEVGNECFEKVLKEAEE